MFERINCFTVYKHTAPNGKIYIGITGRKAYKRWNCGNGYRANNHFWKAIQKYGWQNIQHKVIVSGLTKKQACVFEEELIDKYQSSNPEYGYNHSSGGENPATGYKHSEEFKQKARLRFTGRIFTEETRKKMSESAKKRDTETRHRVLSDETRRKISESRKGAHASDRCRELLSIKNSYGGNPSAKKVKQYTLGGELVATYSCIKEAADKNGCNSHHIGSVCRGERNTCGGFVWRYAEAV